MRLQLEVAAAGMPGTRGHLIFIYPDYPVDPVKKMEIPILSRYFENLTPHQDRFMWDLTTGKNDFGGIYASNM